MAKQIVLSNGDLTIGLDSQGQVQEIYYPDVSRGNHVGSRSLHHKIGVYCEGAVHWLDDGAWTIKQTYYPGRLISRTLCDNRWLDIRLEIQDYVDSELNVLNRNVSVINLSRRSRTVKLFLHQSFVINDNTRQPDTAQYIPAGELKGLNQPSIAHYHGDVAMLVAGQCCNQTSGFSQYSVGHFGRYGDDYFSGVWCDAADGHLSGNSVEQGQTDSIIGFDLNLTGHDSAYVNYYLSANASVAEAAQSLGKFLREGVDMRTKRTAGYWLDWLQPALPVIKQQISPDYRYDVIDALVSVCGNISTSGAVVTTTDVNGASALLVQPKVAALTAVTLSQLNLELEAGRIYDFFTKAIGKEGYLLPTYQADGTAGPNAYAWQPKVLPINLGDTAAILLALCQSIGRASTGRSVPAEWRKRWQKLGTKLAGFLADYIDPITKLPRAAYPSWSNQPLTSTSDTCLAYAALMAAANTAELLRDTDGVIQYRAVADDLRDNAGILWNEAGDYFYRGFNRQDEVISYDSTFTSDALLSASLSGLFSDQSLAAAQATLERNHLCTNGTYIRYAGDNDRSGAALSQIMTLSLMINREHTDRLTGLLAACQTALNHGGYLAGPGSLATNDVMLKMAMINACLALHTNQGDNHAI